MSVAIGGDEFVHRVVGGGVELAVDRLGHRQTAALSFRMLTGVVDDPPELTGIGSIVERTLSKGTQRYTGQELADAFDARGAQWNTIAGRQSMLLRVVCLPEFVGDVIDLAGEMFCRPTFPEEACRVAVQLAQEELTHLEDDPYELVRIMIQRLTLGPVLGRDPRGSSETLPRIEPDTVREHWRRCYHSGRLQVAAAGPLDVDAVARRVEQAFAGLGSPQRAGRAPAGVTLTPAREHRHKDLKQEYVAITLPGMSRDHVEFPVEQVLVGVLAGGMSGRLFTEVREKQGLVYWVGAWSEQPRGAGIVHLGASTTPERCDQTFRTLLHELGRLSEDLTEDEVRRARDSLIAHYETEDDLTPARAAALSDDLFHFGRPIGLAPKLDAIRRVTVADVERYVRSMPRDRLCVATIGPRELSV
jgi:predicted Zn-dependent peptidase